MHLDERDGWLGIGTRSLAPAPGANVESRLQVDDGLVQVDGFVEAVVRQQEAFAALDHPQLAAIRGVERRRVGHRICLEVVSAHAPGESLAHLLDRQSRLRSPLSTAAALFIVRELLAVLRAMHVHRPGSFHGALTLDAVVVTADQRVVVRDHLFGRALASVSRTPAQWWLQHGVAVPTTPGIPAFTPLTDQFQLGLAALSAFLGRPVSGHDDLAGVGSLLGRVRETSIDGDEQLLGTALKSWLSRTLLIAPEGPFRSLNAASDALDELLDSESGYVAAPIGLDVDVTPVADPAAVAHVAVAAYDPFVTPAAAAPEAAEARPDPFAGHTFIIESNDGRSASLSPDQAATYEPFAVAPTASRPASIYSAPHETSVVETNALSPIADAGPLAVVLPAPVAPVPVASPAVAASASPPPDAPRPFWEIQPAVAKEAPGAGTVLSFARPPDLVTTAPEPEPPRAVKDRAPVVTPTLDLVVNAPPPTLGVVTPVVTTHVSTKTSSLLRAAVEEFEQPASPAPPPAASHVAAPVTAPSAAQAPAAAPAPPPAKPEHRHDSGHGAAAGPQSPRVSTGQHAVAYEPPLDMPPRHSSLGLDDFESEVAPRNRSRLLVVAVVLAVVMGGGLAAGYLFLWPKGDGVADGEPGRLRLESKPSGAVVRVNGVEKGQTPITVAVPPGSYRIEFERGDEARTISAAVNSNNETYQVVTLYPPGPPGTVEVTSTPRGASVSVNGEPRGTTPLTLDGLPPGEYTVVVENAVARSEKKVEVMPEQVAAVDIPLSGTLEVSSPIPVQITDRDRPLGQLRSGRIAVGAGLRRLRLANEELGFEESREVEVAAGGVTRLVVSPPSGVLNITADTETDVYLDGRPIGLTPLTNLSVPLGVHEVAFKHAQWGDQNYTVLVGLTTPSRLHVTMTVKAPKIQQRRTTPAPRRRY